MKGRQQMKVFLSWSGERSKAVADALGPWLRQVIQSIEPWLSTEIRKGARWGPEISDQLELTKVGIICLTRDNLTEPWILFEAGALSKTKDAVVATFLLDVSKSDVIPPLSQFQHTSAEEADVRALVHSLNSHVKVASERALPDGDLDEVFELFWPKLKQKLKAIPALPVAKTTGPIRSDSEILREILDVVRAQQPQLLATSTTLASVAEVTEWHRYRILITGGTATAIKSFLNAIEDRENLEMLKVEGTPEGTRVVVRSPTAHLRTLKKLIERTNIEAEVVKLSRGGR